MTAKILGGLFFENVVKEYQHLKSLQNGVSLTRLLSSEPYFELFANLYKEGFVQGLQIRVAHQSYTPNVSLTSLPEILSILPNGCEIVVHAGAENTGADPACNFDSAGTFAKRGNGRTQGHWVMGTLNWALEVALALDKKGMLITPPAPMVIAHPGYDLNILNWLHGKAARTTANRLNAIDDGNRVAVENIPPVVRAEWYPNTVSWSQGQKKYLGAGGTPTGMRDLLHLLGGGYKFVPDFAHMIVLLNQATHINMSGKSMLAFALVEWTNFNNVINGYFALPHWDICHYGGLSKGTLIDECRGFDQPPAPAIVERLTTEFGKMRYICLEIPYEPKDSDSVKRNIDTFRKRYGVY